MNSMMQNILDSDPSGGDPKIFVSVVRECAHWVGSGSHGDAAQAAQAVIEATYRWERGEDTLDDLRISLALAVGLSGNVANTVRGGRWFGDCAAIVRRHIPQAPPLDSAGV